MPVRPSKVLVILNPTAGQDDTDPVIEQIRRRIEEAGIDYELRLTRGEGDALRWCREADGFDRVIVGGGDGTVMEAMSGLVESDAPLGLAQLPLGTANLLAKALAVPGDLDGAIDLALGEGAVASMDVGFLPGHKRYFALVAGSGWDAEMIEGADREMKDKLGFFAYVVSGVKSAFSLRRSRVTVTIDGEKKRFRAHTVMVINVGEIHGTGIALGEHLSPHDGKLDLAIATPDSMRGVLRLLFRILTRRFDGSNELRYFSASRLRVDARPPLKLEIDGEPIGETPFEVEVVPNGSRLVVPVEYLEAKGLEEWVPGKTAAS